MSMHPVFETQIITDSNILTGTGTWFLKPSTTPHGLCDDALVNDGSSRNRYISHRPNQEIAKASLLLLKISQMACKKPRKFPAPRLQPV
jgi:hypothetical protein